MDESQKIQIKTEGVKIFSLILIFFIITIFKFFLSFFLPSFQSDIDLFRAWSKDLAENGFFGFYERWNSDYSPGYLFLLFFCGKIAKIFSLSVKWHNFLIKFWTILFEAIGGYLIYLIGKKHKKEKLGFYLAIFYLLNLAVIFNSSIWGQCDTLLATLLLLTFYFFEEKKIVFAILFFTLSVLTKLQGLFLLPLVIILFFKNFSLKRFFLSILVSFFIFYSLSFPFFKKNETYFILKYLFRGAKQYPFATVNAFNFWMLMKGQLAPENNQFFGLTYFKWALIFLVPIIFISLFLILKNFEDPFFLYFSPFFLYFGIFLFLTRIHERYLVPALIFLYPVLFFKPKLWPLILILSFTSFSNMWYIYYRALEGMKRNDINFLWVKNNDPLALFISGVNFFVFLFVLLFAFFLIFKKIMKKRE
ncbi:MAG: hypothetical protein ACK413_03020 [Patescibacteria group bacterium]